MRRLALPALVFTLLAGFLAWWFSPRQIVKRQTNRLVGLVTFDQGTPPATRALGTFSLSKLLDDPVRLEIPSVEEANGTFSRQDLEAGYQWLCRSAKESQVRVTDFEAVTVTGDSAVVETLLDARVDMQSHRPADGPVRATFEWRKGDDGWRLAGFRWDASN